MSLPLTYRTGTDKVTKTTSTSTYTLTWLKESASVRPGGIPSVRAPLPVLRGCTVAGSRRAAQGRRLWLPAHAHPS